MDPKYEFEAPQYVDFDNLTENDNEVDEFFNVDMEESGEAWVTANNTLGDHVSTSHEEGSRSSVGTFEVVHVREPKPMSFDVDDDLLMPPSSLHLEVPKQPRKPPSNMVTSWSGPVTKILGQGIFSTKSTQQPRTRKPSQGKIGRADIQIKSYVQAAQTTNNRSKPKHLYGTPRRLPVGKTRLRESNTPKRLGTNSLVPRLALSKPRTQVHKSLNTPTASRVRRKSKSPISVQFPKTPAVIKRVKNRQLGDHGHVDNDAQQPEQQRLLNKEKNSQPRFRSQAEQMKLFQHSTPARFRSRPKHSKSAPVAPTSSLLGARPKTGTTVKAAHPKPAPVAAGPASSYLGARPKTGTTVKAALSSKKSTVVDTIRNSTKDNLQEREDLQVDTIGSKNVGKLTVTIPAPFNFTTETRAEERAKFELLVREKETAAKEQKRFEEVEKAKEDDEEMIKARRALVHKALPVQCSKPLIIKKSDKRPTIPMTPQFLRSISMRKKNCGK